MSQIGASMNESSWQIAASASWTFATVVLLGLNGHELAVLVVPLGLVEEVPDRAVDHLLVHAAVVSFLPLPKFAAIALECPLAIEHVEPVDHRARAAHRVGGVEN